MKSVLCCTFRRTSHFSCLPLSLPSPLVQWVSFYSSLFALSDFNQVFYGRYLKRLSNKTQEALGDMSKVKPPPYLNMKVLKVGFVGRPGSVSRPSHCTSLQRSPPRREEIF